MSDNVRISYSFELNPQTPASGTQAPPTAVEPLLAFANCERVHLGNGSVILLNRDSGGQMTVTAEVANALSYCTSFRTLREHAEMLVNTVPQLSNQLTDVIAVLTKVQQAGIMLTARTVCERLSPATPPQASPAPVRVCIITCDRPAAVQRLLDSMLAHGRLAGHDQLFLVDDSRDPRNGEQNRELVARFNLTSPETMHYVGAEAQGSLVRQLVAARPLDRAAIQFLLDRERWASRPSYGLARTVCLLLTVGYRCIVLDDDVLFRCVKPPAVGAGVSFGAGKRELVCFDSETQLLQRADYLDDDPVSGHARYLGMPLARAITDLGVGGIDQATLQGLDAEMLDSLHADSPVLVTQCGSWGDPGTVSSNWLYQLDRESIRRILAAPGGLAGTVQNRYYWLGRPRPNISKMGVMSQATGLDNSQLLPPYFPVFRNEDYLFASMVRFLHPTAAVLDCNWSIPHLPLEPRGKGLATDGFAARGGLGLCGRYLGNRAELNPGVSASTGLTKLAVLVREFSECEPTGLLAKFRAELARERADQLQELNRKLKQAPELGSPDWQNFLQRASSDVARALQSPASVLDIPGVPDDLDEAALLARVQVVLGEFSTALDAWPGLRQSAAAISEQMLISAEFAA